MPSSGFQFLLHFGRFLVLCLVTLSFLQIQYFLWGLSPIKSCMSPPFLIVVYNCILHANDTGLLHGVWFSSLRTFSCNFFVIVYAWYMFLFVHDQLSHSAAHLCFSWQTIRLLPDLVINNYKGSFWKLLTSSHSFSRFDIDWMHSQFNFSSIPLYHYSFYGVALTSYWSTSLRTGSVWWNVVSYTILICGAFQINK